MALHFEGLRSAGPAQQLVKGSMAENVNDGRILLFTAWMLCRRGDHK